MPVGAVGELTGYVRVSTSDQDASLQIQALTEAGCYRIFTDTMSGAAQHRPELDKLMDQIRPGDTLVVWRLDRLGRSLRHLIDSLNQLQDAGIGFRSLIELVADLEARDIGLRSLNEQIDTTTANGRLMFHMFSALSEFERELIQERTKAGLAAARSRGRQGGRPALLTREKLTAARKMYEQQDMTAAQSRSCLNIATGHPIMPRVGLASHRLDCRYDPL